MKIKILLIGYILYHLDSFAIGPIPLPWVGLIICLLASISYRIIPFNTLTISYMIMILFILIATILNTKYKIPYNYIIYRLLNIITFFTVINYIAMRASSNNIKLYLDKEVVNIGIIISIISIIVFIMHIFNLGDIPRNRIGTSGGGQPIAFTFEIGDLVSRALGTFREPSFLAMALILPGTIALKNNQWKSLLLISFALYLTYSLGALFAIILGAGFTVLFYTKIKKLFTSLVIYLVIIYLLLFLFSDSVIIQRFMLIISGDIYETSRGYIYSNINILFDNWIIGGGLGNLSYRLADLLEVEYPVSVLNLYLNILTSGGIIALLCILYWLIYPNINLRRYRVFISDREAFLLLLPLNIFLFLYLSSFEELHIWHAFSFGLVLGRIRQIKLECKFNYIK